MACVRRSVRARAGGIADRAYDAGSDCDEAVRGYLMEQKEGDLRIFVLAPECL